MTETAVYTAGVYDRNTLYKHIFITYDNQYLYGAKQFYMQQTSDSDDDVSILSFMLLSW